MKKKLFLIICGVILFLFITITSFLWYKVFYKGPVDGISVLEVKLDKEENAVVDNEGAIPIKEEEVENVLEYAFQVHNSSNDAGLYQVIIEDAVITDDVLYQGKALLSRTQLSYQLKMNGNIVQEGKLSDIKNNILDTKSIDPGKTNEYKLKVYLSEEVSNTVWQDKYYHYKITVKTEGELE